MKSVREICREIVRNYYAVRNVADAVAMTAETVLNDEPPPSPEPPPSDVLNLDGIDREFLREMRIKA